MITLLMFKYYYQYIVLGRDNFKYICWGNIFLKFPRNEWWGKMKMRFLGGYECDETILRTRPTNISTRVNQIWNLYSHFWKLCQF